MSLTYRWMQRLGAFFVMLSCACVAATDTAVSIITEARLSVAPATVPADGLTQATVTFDLNRVAGITGAGVAVTLSSDLIGVVIQQPGPTDANGRTQATVTSTNVGTATIHAAVMQGSVASPVDASASIQFTKPVLASAVHLTLTAHADDVVADGQQAISLTLMATDQDGQAIVGESVSVTSSQATDIVSPTRLTTDALGSATFAFRADIAGARTITARLRSGAVQTQIHFTAGALDATASRILLNISNLVGDGIAASTGRMTATDIFGNPIAGVVVTLSSSDPTDVLSPTSGTTDASGDLIFTVQSSQIGSKIITASIGTSLFSTGLNVVAPFPDSAASSFVVSPASARADGSSVATLTVTVREVSGIALSQVPVSLSATGSANTLNNPNGLTDTSGNFVATLSSTHAEVKNLVATLPMTSLSAKAVFVAGAPTAANSNLTLTPQTVAANGVASTSVVVAARDQFNNPVPSANVTLTVSGTANVFGNASGQTDSSGMFATTLSSTHAETKTVMATLASTTLSANVTFTADANHITASIVASPNIVVADGSSSASLTTTVLDTHGNPVANEPISLAASGANNAFSQTSGNTDASGHFTTTLTATSAGTKIVTASVAGTQAQISVVFQAGAAASAQSSLVASPGNVLANGTATSTLTLTVRDKNNNLVANQPVSLSVSGSSNTAGATSGTTDGSGVWTTSLASTKAETKNVQASFGSASASVSVAFVAGSLSLANSTLVASPNSLTADGTSQTTLSLAAFDAQNNPLADANVTVTLTGTANVLSASAGQTDSSGHFAVMLQSTKAQSKTVTAAVGGSSISTNVTFVAGSLSASQSSLVASPTSLTADGNHLATLTLSVRDASGNPVANQSVTLVSASAADTLTQAAASTDANGLLLASLKSTLAQSADQITASFTNNPGVTVATNVQFVAGPPDQGHCSLNASPNSIVDDGVTQTSVTLSLRDTYNNPVANTAVNFTASGTNNSLGTTSGSTNAQGQLQTTLASTRAEGKTVTATATAGAGNVTLQVPVVVTTGAPSNANTTFVASPNQVVANNANQSVLSLTVRDGQNNPIGNQAVSFATSGPGAASLGMTSGTTGANGVVSTTLKNATSGVQTVTASYNNTSSSVQVTFVAGPPTNLSSLSANQNNVTADGMSTTTLAIVARDAQSNPVANQTVALSAAGGSCVFANANLSTDTSGTASTTLTSTLAGNKTITATIAGTVQLTTNVNFVAGAASSSQSSLTASPNNQTANANSPIALVVTAKDAYGNLITNQSVSLSSPQSADVFAQATGSTNSSGQYATTVTSSLAGTRTLSAAVGGINVSTSVSFVAGPPTSAASVLTASPNTLTADGNSQTTLSYTLRDQNNNLVIGAPVSLSSSGSNNTFAQATGTTNSSGVYQTTMTSTRAENKTVTAASGSNSTNTTSVRFGVGAAQASTSSIVASPNMQTAGSATITLSATVRDAQNNPIGGQAVTFSGSGSNNTFSSATSTTDTSGRATASLSSTRSQTETVTAAFGGINVQTTVGFTPNVAASPNTTLTSNISQVTANGNATATLTVTAKDAYGNLIANQAVALSSTGGNNTFVNSSGSTNASGVFQATLASTAAESKTITAAVGNASATVNINFVAGNPQTFDFVANPNSVVADGNAAAALTLTVRDSDNNPVSGAAATFSSSDSNDMLNPSSANTDANGQVKVSLKTTVAGAKTIAASVGGVQVTTGVTFYAGNPNSAQSTLVASPNSVTADGQSSMTLTFVARDAFGNPVPSANVALSTTNASATLAQPNGQTASDGTYSTSLSATVAGNQTVTANTASATSSITVNFSAGAPSQGQSSLSVNPNSVTADGTSNSNIVVVARDAQGNLVQNQNVSLSLSGSAYTFVPSAGVTDANGRFAAALSSTAAQANVVITAALGGASLTRSITFVAGPPAQAACTLSASPNSITADGSSATTLTFFVADAHANPVAGVAASLTAGGTNNTLSGVAAATDASGKISGMLTSTYAETKVITAAASGYGISLNTNVTFVPGAVSSTYSSLTASPNNVTADGVSTTTISVSARDAQNNPIANQAVSLSSNGNNNTFAQASGQTNGSGTYTTTLQSTTAQTKSLTAALGSSATASGQVTFVAGAASTSTSTFVASPNSVTADGTSTATLTLNLSDAQNNPIALAPISLTSSGSNNTFSPANANTNSAGSLSVTLASTSAETKTVVAHFPGGTLSTTLSFKAGAATSANSSFTASPNQVVANNANTTQLTVTLRDAQNNPVSGNTVSFSATGSSNTFAPSSSNTTSGGTASSAMTSSVAESKTVTATFSGGSINVGVVFVAGPPAAAYSTFVASPNQVAADGTSTAALTHTVRDAQNNPVGNQTVTLSASGSANTFSPASGATNATSGVFAATLASTLAQTQTVTSTASPIAQAANVTFLAGAPSSSTSTLVASPNQVVANNSNTTALLLTVRDAQNNPIGNQNVTFSSNGASNTFSSTQGYTNASGQLSVSLMSSVAQSKTVTAAFGSASTTVTVVFVAGPAASANSTLVASPTSLTADGTATTTLSLSANDAYNNRIGATTVTYTATGSANTFSPASNTTANGQSTTTLASTLAQTETITASFGGASATTTVTFVAGAAASAQSSITASPNSLTADNASSTTLVVTVKDAKGNLVANANVTLSASGANNTFAATSGVSNSSGQFSATLKSSKAQSESISAALGGGSTPPTVSTTVVFVAGASSSATSSLVANPNSNTADGSSVITLMVTALDAFGNPLNGAAVSLSGSGTGNTIANPNGTTNSSGVYTTQITSTVAQTENVSANISP